jgi:Sulfotransferase domain
MTGMSSRIAMWSGPRNLSTAMMYAFAARGDCAVWDEPFYAAYLAATGIDHPMRDAVIGAGMTDPAQVAAACVGPIPQEQTLFYQKHMTLHMIPDFDRGFLRDLTNVFLIRHPARVVASYAKKREAPTLMDIGFVQQAELFDQVAQVTDAAPLVIWAPHWYNAVHASTGFEGPEGPLPVLSPDFQALCDQAMPHYTRLSAAKL